MSEETSEKLEGTRRPPIVGRVLIGVLIFQLGLAVLLFWGDLGEGLRLPGFGPRAPELTEPIRPAAFAPNARQIPASRCPIPPCPTG